MEYAMQSNAMRKWLYVSRRLYCFIFISFVLSHGSKLQVWAYTLDKVNVQNITTSTHLISKGDRFTYDWGSELYYESVTDDLLVVLTLSDSVYKSCYTRTTQSNATIYDGKWDPVTKISSCIATGPNLYGSTTSECATPEGPMDTIRMCAGKSHKESLVTAEEWKNEGIYARSKYDALISLQKIGCVIQPDLRSTQRIEYSGSYTFKLNCKDGGSVPNLLLQGECYQSASDLIINGVRLSGANTWVIPVNKRCGESVTLVPTAVGDYGCASIQSISAQVCDLKIEGLSSSVITINPDLGGAISITANISNSSAKPIIWTLNVGGKDFRGTGKAVSVSWNTLDPTTGKPLPPGKYNATLSAQTEDGVCRDTKSFDVVVEISCDLKAKLSGPDTPLSFATGGAYPIYGAYTTSSSKNVNWLLALPNGSTKSGIGSVISAIWDGTLSNGTLAPVGDYQAVLTVSSSDDATCTASSSLPITVSSVPDTCGLIVSFGSTANVANGNLAHLQGLFTSRSEVLSTGMTLYYNSLDQANGSAGRGWSHSYLYSLKEKDNGSVLISFPNWKYDYFTLANGIYTGQPGNYSTLVKNSNGSFSLIRKDGQAYTFANGTLVSISDRNGNSSLLTYSNGNLISVTDPSGRTITYNYDSSNHLTSITDTSGNVYTFTVGTTLNSVNLPDGGIWRYTYDVNAFMLSKTDSVGNTTSYTFDDRHRVISSTDPEGRERRITYPQTTDAVKSTTFTEKDGGVWIYGYDTQKGYLLSKTDPQGGTTSYGYDASGNRTSTTLPDGTTTGASYDAKGNMLTSTDAMGQTTSYTYNGFGQVTSSTDQQGNSTRYGYDSKGNLTSLTDPTGATTTFGYDARGILTKMTDPVGATITYAYDEQSNLISVTNSSGAITTYTYDVSGNMTSSTDPQGGVTSYSYDASGHLIKTVDPLGNIASYTYDLMGNKISDADANGNVTSYRYNAQNRLVATIDALNNTTAYSYGGSSCPSCGGGNGEKLTSLTDANGNTTMYLYDQLGRLSKETDPLGNATTYTHDSKTSLVSKTDGNGAIVSYSYDANGRLLKKSYPDGSEVKFSYDPKGNILTAANGNISYTFTYDAGDRTTSSTDSSGRAIRYTYDTVGRKTGMTAPDGSQLAYTYDSAGRLAAMTSGGTYTFGYDSLGQRTSLTYPNGDTASYSYDKQGRLANIARKNASGASITGNSYTMDKVGNRLTNTTPERTSSYGYDNIYRLLQAITNTPGNSGNTKSTKGTANAVQQQNESFTYDPVGNRLTSEKSKNYTYNANNQLIANSGTYTYDKNGNLAQKTTAEGITTYSWDYENRLIKATTATTRAEYVYDPLGRRIQKKVAENDVTTTTNYFYDGQAILFEYDDTGAITNRYVHGPNIDEPLSLTTGNEQYYYHQDGLGTVVALTDRSGKVVQTYEYDSFGNLKDQKNRIKQPFTYTSREWDKETGTYHYRKRTYDPMEGRFISKDPIGFEGGINLYNYSLSNPINYTDPYGERVSVFTRSLDMKVKSGSYVHCVLVVEKCDGTKQTWDFQNDNKVYNPAKTPSNPIKNPVTTVVYAKDDLDDKVSFLANQMGHPNYDTTKYNCCYWVEDVLKRAGISWKNPNPWPAN